MSTLITDFKPRHRYAQTIASSSHSVTPLAGTPSKSFSSLRQSKFCVAMAVCLFMQIASFAALANADDDFGLIDAEQPACKDCAQNNGVPQFSQTRVALNDSIQSSSAMIGSAPVVEAPPAIGNTTPIGNNTPMQSIESFEGALEIANSEQINQLQTGQTQILQSGGLGESASDYPMESDQFIDQSGYVPLDQSGYHPQSWGQTYDQVFNYGADGVSGVEQVNYDTQYSDVNYGQEIVSGDAYFDAGSAFYSDSYWQDFGGYSSATQNYDAVSALPPQSYAQTYTSSNSSGNVQPGLAQQKANQAAQGGIQGHLGGSLGGAKYEGVGWSNQSAQNAIQSCCYWGTRPTAQIGVAKGNDGFWYACVLYY